ncbi:ATP-binding protein [Sphaerisporangium aureirubrum]|uniref:ATP-binding protein n=1 Tax=Sphaerisporangium aureirubrum TaxID=1544736 RepID=A0ABW1N7Y7_9ACTN
MSVITSDARMATRAQSRPVLPVRSAWRDGSRASWLLAPEPTTVPRIRRRVRRQLAEWGVPTCGDVIELLVSEIVTNAMRHAWGAVITLSMDNGTCRCEVRDTNPAMPAICCPHEADEGGRGMYLMEALSDRWGSYPVPTGKVVWFEVACSPGNGHHDA